MKLTLLFLFCLGFVLSGCTRSEQLICVKTGEYASKGVIVFNLTCRGM